MHSKSGEVGRQAYPLPEERFGRTKAGGHPAGSHTAARAPGPMRPSSTVLGKANEASLIRAGKATLFCFKIQRKSCGPSRSRDSAAA